MKGELHVEEHDARTDKVSGFSMFARGLSDPRLATGLVSPRPRRRLRRTTK